MTALVLLVHHSVPAQATVSKHQSMDNVSVSTILTPIILLAGIILTLLIEAANITVDVQGVRYFIHISKSVLIKKINKGNINKGSKEP